MNPGDPSPSLHPQYRSLTTTTGQSAPLTPNPRGEEFPRSVLEPEPGSRHLYAGHHQANKQAPAWLIPGCLRDPGFDATSVLTAPHQWFTHVRLPGPHLTPSLRLFRIAHYHAISRTQQHAVVWNLPLQSGPGGPTSITSTAPHTKTQISTSEPPCVFVAHHRPRQRSRARRCRSCGPVSAPWR